MMNRLRDPGSLLSDAVTALRARWLLRSAQRMGPRVRVWGRMVVRNSGKLLVGDHVRLVSTIVPIELYVEKQGCLEIGSDVYINYGTSIAACDSVKIGDHCSIGTYCIIMDSNFHRLEPERRGERPEPAPVFVQDNVWLGARVIVLPGVTIGRDSAVAAGSVVTQDIPPRTLAGGVPARVIRSL